MRLANIGVSGLLRTSVERYPEVAEQSSEKLPDLQPIFLHSLHNASMVP